MGIDEIIAELKRSINEDKLPLHQMNVNVFYEVCNYLTVFEENVFTLKDIDLRVYLLLIMENINENT